MPTPSLLQRNCESQTRLLHLQKISFQIQASKLRKQYSRRNLYKQLAHSRLKDTSTVCAQQKQGKFLQPTKIISVSASKWSIYDMYTMHYIRGFRSHDQHDLSIFSKTLVFCAIHTLVIKNSIDIKRFQVIVPSTVSIPPTFPLHHDDILSLQDVLSLMVMEQSQVYELILSLNFGTYLVSKSKRKYFSVFDVSEQDIAHFYDCVNRYAHLMKLDRIKYCTMKENKLESYCSAADIALLSIQCLKIPLFGELISKEQHTVHVKYIDGDGKEAVREQTVVNKSVSNEYLQYVNVCRNWEQNSFKNSHCAVKYQPKHSRPVVIVLLGSYNREEREKDIQQIAEWYYKEGENYKYRFNNQLKSNLNGKLRSGLSSMKKKVSLRMKSQATENKNQYLQQLENKFIVPQAEIKTYTVKLKPIYKK